MTYLHHHALFLCAVVLLASCANCGGGNNNSNNGDPDSTVPNNGAGDMGTPDGANPDPDAGDPDTGPVDPGNVIACSNSIAAPAAGLCDATVGSNGFVLFQMGQVLAGDDIYENGTVLVDTSNGNDDIVCVGCDCGSQGEASGATVVSCAEGVLSPSIINPHEHLTFSLSWPQPHGEERFEHRNDWRRGIRGHNEVNLNPGGDDSREGVLYGEARMLFGGATSIAGSSSDADAAGFLRNLDKLEHLEGLTGINVDYRTFPLGDVDGTLRNGDCNYPDVDSESRARAAGIYLPHIAEGIDPEAHNEYVCASGGQGGPQLVGDNTSVIHGIGLTVEDIADMASKGANLVWSPRSNIDLYGNTARVPLFKLFDIPIALGTDWSASGSMNVLRELKCADYLNQVHYGRVFSDQELWKMSTLNAAIAMGADNQIGIIRERYVADLAIFDGRERDGYRAVIDAETEDVHLVLRGGVPLYGDANLVEALVPASDVALCEEMDVCGEARRICAERDIGMTIGQLQSAVSQNAYPLFFCEEPDREPSCVPFRSGEYDGAQAGAGEGDGDGITDGEDNCVSTFNPVRPMDPGQPNVDGDDNGDDCDTTPLGDDYDPSDRDGDGVANVDDNCALLSNPDQADADSDGNGDLCDRCSDYPNPGNGPCPATVYEIRAGTATDAVIIEGVVVTARSDRAFFVQVPDDASYYQGLANSGLYVYTGSNGPAPPQLGDVVDVSGSIDVFGDTLELVASAVTVSSSGHALPDFTEVAPAEIATGGARADELQGTLVRVRDVTVTNANPDAPDDFAEFEVTGGLRVDDLLYVVDPDPTGGEQFAILQGVLNFSFGNSKLLPRSAADLITGPPALDSLQPSTVYLEAGMTGVPTPPLRIQLTGPALGDTTVTLAYSGNVTGPPTATVPDGQDSIDLAITAQAVGSGTVTATLGNDSSSATVQVYDDATPRTVTAVTPSMTTVTINGTAMLTVAIAPPAGASGQTVSLAYAPGGVVTGPGTVDVPTDAVSATFSVTAGATAGNATVTATIGASSQSADVSVVSSAANCLIISEYIEGSGSNNKAFEIFNCSPGPLDLSGFAVCLITNAATSCSQTLDLPAMQLATGDVLTVCRSNSGADPDPVAAISANCDIVSGTVANFNGNDRLVVFEDTNGNTALDATDTVTDAFGEIANPPASEIWKDATYRRCDFTQYDGVMPFDVAVRFTAHPNNDASDYGTPPTEGCP